MTDPVVTALEQHAHSLRELARTLVGAGDADDVVQATAAEAVARPRAVREPLAFLRHVLRVQARRLHRGEARRRRREHAHAVEREAAAPPAEHAIEQREAIAQLHQALMAVPQPHLGALLLRWFEGLSPPAIAARLAVPLPTIKSRLARGLELLREELDRRGPRDQWQQRLAAAFALPPKALLRTSAVAPFAALIVMKLAAVLCLVALAATVWLLWPRDDAAPRGPVSVVSADPTRVTAAEAAPPPDPAQALARSEAPAARPATTARLFGRVTGSDGTPLAGAKVTLVPSAAPGIAAVASALTEADGAFTCDAPPGQYLVRVAAAHHVGVQSDKRAFAAGTTTDVGTIAMRPGVVVRGRVVDRDGKVIADTQVATGSFQPPNAPAGWSWWREGVRTGADGRFELGPLLPAQYALLLPEEQLLEPVMLQLSAEADVEIELRVESASRQLTLRGRVVDEGGRGISGAKVTATERADVREIGFVATSGDDGAFSIRRLLTAAPKPVPVTATAAGRDETRLEQPVEWGRSDVEIVLRPLAALTLRVVGADGAPVPRYAARLSPLKEMGPGIAWHVGHFAVHDADAANGELTLRDLRRGFHDVHVTPAGERLAASGVRRIQITGALQHETIVLPPRARRVVHLRAADGAAVAGGKVELCQPCLGAVDLHTQVIALERWTNVHMPGKALLLQSAGTDANGDVTLDGPVATPLALRVLGPGCLPCVVPIERLDGEGSLVVDCRRGGTLRVVASPVDVLTALDAVRNVERDEPRPHAWLLRDGNARERVPSDRGDRRGFDGSGIATIDGLPDGTWVPRVGFGREEIVLPPVAIADGVTTEVTLDLTPLRPVTIRGRVVADMPVAGRSVDVERLRGVREPNAGRWTIVGGTSILLDDTGAFVLRTLPGRFRLLLSHQRADGDRAALLAQPADVDVAPGAVLERTFTIATGSVAVRFVDREQRPVAGVAGAQLWRADGHYLANLPPTDDQGRTRFDYIEAGRIRLVVLPRRFGAAKTAVPKLFADHPNEPDIVVRTMLELGQIAVEPGEPVEQTFVLPDAWFR